jgi:hypothetical protein
MLTHSCCCSHFRTRGLLAKCRDVELELELGISTSVTSTRLTSCVNPTGKSCGLESNTLDKGPS